MIEFVEKKSRHNLPPFPVGMQAKHQQRLPGTLRGDQLELLRTERATKTFSFSWIAKRVSLLLTPGHSCFISMKMGRVPANM